MVHCFSQQSPQLKRESETGFNSTTGWGFGFRLIRIPGVRSVWRSTVVPEVIKRKESGFFLSKIAGGRRRPLEGDVEEFEIGLSESDGSISYPAVSWPFHFSPPPSARPTREFALQIQILFRGFSRFIKFPFFPLHSATSSTPFLTLFRPLWNNIWINN